MQKQQNNYRYAGLVAFYDTRPGNKMGLFYNSHEPTRDHNKHINSAA